MKKSEILENLSWRVINYHVEKSDEGDLLVVRVKSLSFLNQAILKNMLLMSSPEERVIEITFNSNVEID